MAYNFQGYQNYQPYGYQDQLSQLRTPQFYQPQQPSNGLLWVQGEAGAKSYLMAPNSTVMLMDSEAQRFYLKTTDSSGIPNLRTFEYSEIGAVPVQTKQEYVTREEFMNFVNSFKQKAEVENA